jgi:hypothetical protein
VGFASRQDRRAITPYWPMIDDRARRRREGLHGFLKTAFRIFWIRKTRSRAAYLGREDEPEAALRRADRSRRD